MLPGSLDGRGVGVRVYIWMPVFIHMAEFLCCSPETITTLFITVPQHKIKSFEKDNVYSGSKETFK